MKILLRQVTYQDRSPLKWRPSEWEHSRRPRTLLARLAAQNMVTIVGTSMGHGRGSSVSGLNGDHACGQTWTWRHEKKLDWSPLRSRLSVHLGDGAASDGFQPTKSMHLYSHRMCFQTANLVLFLQVLFKHLLTYLCTGTCNNVQIIPHRRGL
jgi:hypothetical protein